MDGMGVPTEPMRSLLRTAATQQDPLSQSTSASGVCSVTYSTWVPSVLQSKPDGLQALAGSQSHLSASAYASAPGCPHETSPSPGRGLSFLWLAAKVLPLKPRPPDTQRTIQ